MILNPYETTYGKVIYNKNDMDKVKDYVISNSNGLNYEFRNSDAIGMYEPCFILGRNSLEQNLPILNQSMIFTHGYDTGYVVSDLRRYISKNILRADVMNIYNSGFITNRAGLDLEVVKTLIACEMSNSQSLAFFKKSFNSIAISYAVMIGNLLRIKLNYGPVELIAVRMACVYFVLMLFGTSNDTKSYRDTVIDKMLHINYGGGASMDARTKMSYFNELTATGDTIDILVKSINDMFAFVSYPVTINSGLILQTISEFFKSGPNGNENIMVGLEYMPNFISLVYSSFTEKNYKNTGLTKMLDNMKNLIKPEYIVNDVKSLLSNFTS